MTYFSLRLCSDGGAFEAIPRPPLRLDLGRTRRALESHHIPVVDARVLLIVQFQREVTLARDGRILIKSRDPAEAKKVFLDLQSLLGLPDLDPQKEEEAPTTGTVKAPADL